MKFVKTGLVSTLTLAVVGGTIALTLPDASAAPASYATAELTAAGALTYRAPASSTSTITLDPAGTGFVLSTSTGVTMAPTSNGCTVSGRSLVCTDQVKSVTVHLGDGNDSLINRTGLRLTAWAGPGNDRIEGGSGVDELHGQDGNDHLAGGVGNDRLDGGAGTDELHGGDGADILTSQEGDAPGTRTDVMYGDGGTDSLYWGLLMNGGDGDDYLNVRDDLGSDVYGGPGRDSVSFSSSQRGVQVSLNGLRASGTIAPGEVVGPAGAPVTHGPILLGKDLERFAGTGHDDVIVGNDLANELLGSGGNDRIHGLGGDDVIDVQAGTQQEIYVGSGTDTCRGEGDVLRSGCEL